MLEFSVQGVNPKETSRIDALLQAGALGGFKVPFWCDRVPLQAVLPAGSTTVPLATEGYSFVAGEQLILWNSPFEWELATIQSVTDDSLELVDPTTAGWRVGALMMPIKKGYLAQPVSSSRLSRDGQSSSLTFILCGWTIPLDV